MAVSTGSRPAAKASQEMELVKRYALLGITVRILNHDIRVVGASKAKLPRLYESLLRGLQDRVLLELAAMRKQFKENGIKVLEESDQASGLGVRYLCEGYERSFMLVWSYVRVESERLLKGYSQS